MKCESLGLEQFLEIVYNYKDNKGNRGLYWTKESDLYIGMDNTTGDCWVEEFDTFKQCINWLIGLEG